ncbi:MAG: hypothetical protein ACI845_001725 [Gammaproteobacteria bacterium]|jgi:hypothetical protein
MAAIGKAISLFFNDAVSKIFDALPIVYSHATETLINKAHINPSCIGEK